MFSAVPDSGKDPEEQEVDGGSNLEHPFALDDLCQTAGASVFKHGHSSVGVPPLQGTSMVPETLPAPDCSQGHCPVAGSSPGPTQSSVVDSILQLLWGKQFYVPKEELVVMDASLTGWGATWRGRLVQGRWSRSESCQLINLLELRAIWLALIHFSKQLEGRNVLLRTDNIAAKAHLNKQGGSRSFSLHKEALILFAWVEKTVCSLRAEHIRGLENTQADWLSRTSIQPGE